MTDYTSERRIYKVVMPDRVLVGLCDGIEQAKGLFPQAREITRVHIEPRPEDIDFDVRFPR